MFGDAQYEQKTVRIGELQLIFTHSFGMKMLMERHANHTSKGPGRADRRGITIIELLRRFPDDRAAERWFEGILWKGRPICPDCGSGNHSHCPSHPSIPCGAELPEAV